MLCASGERKPVRVTPVVITADIPEGMVFVHLFQERARRDRVSRSAVGVEPPLVPGRGVNAMTEGPLGRRRLTVRELEVLRLVAMGLTPQEIAAELFISYHTVRKHLSNMRDKLAVLTKLDLVRIGRNLGLL